MSDLLAAFKQLCGIGTILYLPLLLLGAAVVWQMLGDHRRVRRWLDNLSSLITAAGVEIITWEETPYRLRYRGRGIAFIPFADTSSYTLLRTTLTLPLSGQMLLLPLLGQPPEKVRQRYYRQFGWLFNAAGLDPVDLPADLKERYWAAASAPEPARRLNTTAQAALLAAPPGVVIEIRDGGLLVRVYEGRECDLTPDEWRAYFDLLVDLAAALE